LEAKRKWKKPLIDTGVDGRIILKWISMKFIWRVWIGFVWLRIGTGEHGY
jgi:hypothetical protein